MDFIDYRIKTKFSFSIFGGMRKLLILLVMLPFVSFAQEENQQKEENQDTDRIYWSDWYRLEWADFEGAPHDDESIAALSNIGLPYSFDTDGEGILTVNINVCFFRGESWYKKDQENNVLLQHEQLHFDIAEMHRRLIVKELVQANLTKNNYKAKLEEIIERVWYRDYKLSQKKYDEETGYSRMFKPQINWNKYVSQQLRNLEEYSYTEIELSLINFDE